LRIARWYDKEGRSLRGGQESIAVVKLNLHGVNLANRNVLGVLKGELYAELGVLVLEQFPCKPFLVEVVIVSWDQSAFD